jgi:hypothetical protein
VVADLFVSGGVHLSDIDFVKFIASFRWPLHSTSVFDAIFES